MPSPYDTQRVTSTVVSGRARTASSRARRVFPIPGAPQMNTGRTVAKFTIGRYISGLICYLGYLWMLWDREKQCWHDKTANSVVVPEAAYPVQ